MMSRPIKNPHLIEILRLFEEHQEKFRFPIISELLNADDSGIEYGKAPKDKFHLDNAILSLNLNLQGVSTWRIAKFCGISQGAVHKRVKKGVRLVGERFPALKQRIKERKEARTMRLIIRSHFDAAHKLDHIDGPCSTLHGHRWRVEFEFEGPVDKRSGMVEDFHHLKNAINGNLPDHSYLNSCSGIENPTAENISIWLFGSVKDDLRGMASRAKIVSVTVWESDDCGVRYSGEGK